MASPPVDAQVDNVGFLRKIQNKIQHCKNTDASACCKSVLFYKLLVSERQTSLKLNPLKYAAFLLKPPRINKKVFTTNKKISQNTVILKSRASLSKLSINPFQIKPFCRNKNHKH